MRIRLFVILMVACIISFSFQTVSLASIELGWDYQTGTEQPNIQSFQLGYHLPGWQMRGSFTFPEHSLSAGIIREFKTDSALAPYLGIGLQDLTEQLTPELPIGEKTEIITGLKLKLGRFINGVSLGLEAKVTPDDLFGADGSLSPEISISFNYRFSSSGGSAHINSGLSAIKVNQADRKLLAQVVTVEATNEPFNGQVAVAAVVINRVKSSRFPDTVRDVVYQPGQFSYQGKLAAIKPSASAYKAVEEALQGSDPSRGAHYFYNPSHASTAGRRFFSSNHLQVTARIGNHVFLKLR